MSAFAIMIASCGTNTVRQDFEFGSDPNEALIVVKAPETAVETYLAFRKIGLEAKRFVEEGFRVQAGKINLIEFKEVET